MKEGDAKSKVGRGAGEGARGGAMWTIRPDIEGAKCGEQIKSLSFQARSG